MHPGHLFFSSMCISHFCRLGKLAKTLYSSARLTDILALIIYLCIIKTNIKSFFLFRGSLYSMPPKKAPTKAKSPAKTTKAKSPKKNSNNKNKNNNNKNKSPNKNNNNKNKSPNRNNKNKSPNRNNKNKSPNKNKKSPKRNIKSSGVNKGNRGMEKKEFRVPENVSKNTDMSLYFPPTKDSGKLRISDVGIYSVSKPEDAKWITDVILKRVSSPEKKIITDATAGVGGNVISFANKFKGVHAVERDAVHAEMLENNVKVFGYKNVIVHQGDYLDFLPKLKQDVVFIDAPWGGPRYRDQQEVRLFLSGNPVTHIANLLRDKAELIVLKVPRNLSYNNLIKGLHYERIEVYKYFRFHLVLISNPLPERKTNNGNKTRKSTKTNKVTKANNSKKSEEAKEPEEVSEGKTTE